MTKTLVPKPAVLTFHPEFGVLTEKSDIAAYKLRHMLTNPGYASTLFESLKVSFRTLEQKYGSNPEMLAQMVATNLNSVYSRYFNDVSITAKVADVDVENAVYSLQFEVIESVGGRRNNLLSSARIVYNKNKHDFKIVFKGDTE